MNIIRRTLDIDADTDARLREMASERGQEFPDLGRHADGGRGHPPDCGPVWSVRLHRALGRPARTKDILITRIWHGREART
jgi:hypothetical protein